MTTIKATKGEFVNLINGLFAVQDLKGKDFGLVVSKNITSLKEGLKHLEDEGKPSEEFIKLAQKVNEISNENSEDAKEKIDTLEKENEELVKSRREQMDRVMELMKDDISLNLFMISKKVLPNDITAKQINNIEKIIK